MTNTGTLEALTSVIPQNAMRHLADLTTPLSLTVQPGGSYPEADCSQIAPTRSPCGIDWIDSDFFMTHNPAQPDLNITVTMPLLYQAMKLSLACHQFDRFSWD